MKKTMVKKVKIQKLTITFPLLMPRDVQMATVWGERGQTSACGLHCG
jgi:hypothetical protein